MPTLSLNASKKTKHTPAGEIPVDWGWARTQEICSRISVGIVIAPSQYYTDAEDGTLAFRSANVREGKINDSNWVHLNQEGHRKNQKSELKEGDVLIVRTGAPGVACVVSKEFEGSNCIDLVIARPDRNQVASDYLCLFFNSDCGRRQAFSKQGGLAQKHLNVGAVAKLTIPLPPLPEQHRIAAILSTWDRAIETLESLIAAKDRRKQALMQQLLTGRKRLPGFETPWRNVVFGDFLTESRLPGSHGAAARKLTVRLYGRGISEKNEARAGSSNTRYYTRRAGQFIYSKLDFLNGAFAIIPSHLDGLESTLDLPAFDIAPTVHPTWMLTYLTRPEFYENCVGFAAGGRKARRVNPNQFLSIRLKLPSLPEQTAIASVLISADRELALHRQHLEALRTQKRGLMQKLLTGQVRVAP